MPYKVKKVDDLLAKHYGQPVKLSDQRFEDLQRVPISTQVHSTINIDYKCKCKLKDGQTIELKLFVKLSPSCYMTFSIVKQLNLIPRFQKEIHAYTVAIPKITEFQKKEGSAFGENELFINIFPKCFGARLSLSPETRHYPDQDGVIVLENLKSKGFMELDYVRGLNLDTVKVLAGKLALFHAVPLAYSNKHEEDFLEQIQPCLTVTNTSSEFFVTVPSEVALIKDVISSTGLYQQHRERIDNAIAYSAEYMCKAPTEDTWIAMTHGKFFLFNTMVLLTGDRNQVVDCRIIDLQHALKRHILTDLAFLLTTCSSKNLLINHLEEILQHYHKVLTENLEKFDIDLTPYSYDNFKKEFKVNFRKELLRGLQMIKFMSAKRAEKELMRSFATWPRYDKDRVDTAIDKKLYVEKMRDIMANLLETRLIDEDDDK